MLPLTGLAQLVPRVDDARSTRMRQFIERYKVVSIKRNAQQFVRDVQGDMSTPLGNRSPVEVVYEFLEANKDLFGIANPRAELRPLNAGEPHKRTGARHLKFQQLYKGLEVKGAIIGADYNREGVLDWVRGDFYNGLCLPTIPTISREAALEIIVKDIGPADSINVHSCQLLIYPRDTVCYLAWAIFARPRPRRPERIVDSTGTARILIPDDFSRGGDYFIDALSGRTIYHSRGMILEPEIPWDTSAQKGPEGPKGPPPVLPGDKPRPSGTAIPVPDSGWKIIRPDRAEPWRPLKGDTVDSLKGQKPNRLYQPGLMELQALPDSEALPDTTSQADPPALAPPRQSGLADPDAIITIMTQDFEGAFHAWRIRGSPDASCSRYRSTRVKNGSMCPSIRSRR